MNNEKSDEPLVEKKIAVLGISESWMHEEMSDAEIEMAGQKLQLQDGKEKKRAGM